MSQVAIRATCEEHNVAKSLRVLADHIESGNTSHYPVVDGHSVWFDVRLLA